MLEHLGRSRRGCRLPVPAGEDARPTVAEHPYRIENPRRAPGQPDPVLAVTLSRLTKELGTAAVPHGFRSSFRDWAAERTSTPREVIEASLAHTVQRFDGNEHRLPGPTLGGCSSA